MSRALVEQLIATGFATPTDNPQVPAAFMLTADAALLVLREPSQTLLASIRSPQTS